MPTVLKILWTVAITMWITMAVSQSILLKQPFTACLASFHMSHC